MSTLQPASPPPIQPLPGKPVGMHEAEDDVAPSRAMEYWLFGIMAASLAVSISGLAFVYGFDLAHPFSPTNVSPGVRGIIVDSIMFLGVYFTRRFLMHRGKQSWHWGWGYVWLLVALLATGFSWFSNTLAVNALGTIVTQALLNKAGFGSWDAAEVNKVIAALPIVAVLLYAIVPRRVKSAPRMVDTRSPEEILQQAQQEAARIQADRLIRQAHAEEIGEGIGEGISALARGVNLALGRDLRAAHAAKAAEHDALRQMRVLLLRHGWVGSPDKAMKMKPEQIRLLAETKQLWDPATHQPMPWALLPTEAEKRAELRKQALAKGWLTAKEVAQEDEMGYAELQARYGELELRAEALRKSEQAMLSILPADDTQTARNVAGFTQAAPRAEHAPDLDTSVMGDAEPDGFTPKELGERLGKSRATILNWMKAAAREPLKIYEHEVFKDARGNQRISPAVYLRLSRALAAENGPLSRDSSPRIAAVSKVALNGGSHAEAAIADTEGKTT